MKEGVNRRDLLKAVAGALAVGELARARDAKADITPETGWHEGISQLIEMTEQKNLEHGDKFMLFERGGYRWGDQKHKRTLLTLEALPIDWKQVEGQVSIDGPISVYVDVHVHNNHREASATRRRAEKTGRSPKAMLRPYASVPSTVDLRSLFGTHWLIDNNSQANTIPPRSLRSETMRVTSLVLNVHNRHGWYYELFPEEEVRRLHPDVRIKDLVYSKQDPDFALREVDVRDAKFEFESLSLRFNGDVHAMRADLEGEKKYQELLRAYANMGVLLRHVSWEELQKEPPGAGVLYHKK